MRKSIFLVFLYCFIVYPHYIFAACPGTPSDCYTETTCLNGETGTCRLAIECSYDAIQNTINESDGTGAGYVSPELFYGDGVYIPTCASGTLTSTVTATDINLNIIGNAGVVPADPTIGTKPNTGTVLSATSFAFRFSTTRTDRQQFRISAIAFEGSPTGSDIYFGVGGTYPTACGSGWRIDHISIDQSTPNNPIDITTCTYGLIDNSYIEAPGKSIRVNARLALSVDDTNFKGMTERSADTNLGGSDAVYIEDCFLYNTISPNASGNVINEIDLGGGSLVFRHNIVKNGEFYLKWTRSGSSRGYYGARKIEVYGNDFQGNYGGVTTPVADFAGLQAGTGYIYNNKITGYSNNNMYLREQRGAGEESYSPLNACDGNQSWDGNIEVGWPCMGQVGRGKRLSEGNEAWEPYYEYKNGTDDTCITGGSCDDASDFRIYTGSEDHVYIYPSTHTNSQWEARNDYAHPTYSAYTYPHPLQGNDESAPTYSSGSCNGSACSFIFSENLNATAFANLIDGDLVVTGSTTGAFDMESCSLDGVTVSCIGASTPVTGETLTLNSSGLTGDELCDNNENCISEITGESVTNLTGPVGSDNKGSGKVSTSGGLNKVFNSSGAGKIFN